MVTRLAIGWSDALNDFHSKQIAKRQERWRQCGFKHQNYPSILRPCLGKHYCFHDGTILNALKKPPDNISLVRQSRLNFSSDPSVFAYE